MPANSNPKDKENTMKKLITVAIAGCALAFHGASARADVWGDCEAW